MVSEKSEKNEFFSVNFAFGQGNLEFCSKSGKSQGNLYHFGYYEHQVTRTMKGH